LEKQVPTHEPDRRKPKRDILELRNQRAIPLTAAAIGVALVFLPDAVAIVSDSARVLASGDLQLRKYNSVATAFVLVELVSLYLAFHFTGVLLALHRLLKRFSTSPGSGGMGKQ